MTSTDPSCLIDTRRYPLDEPFSVEDQLFIARSRARFAQSGLLVLHGFIRDSALTLMKREALMVEPHAYFVDSTHNVYLTDTPDGLPADDPATWQEQTSVGSVPFDCIPLGGPLRQIYDWDPFKAFIRGVLGAPELYRFEDPLGACSINVFRDGGRHGWHFDESEFSVTLMLQAPDKGGTFEYIPGLRGRADEAKIIKRVCQGERSEVEQLPFTEGTLLIFNGSRSLHRVTDVSGTRSRLVPVLCFSTRPGTCNSEAVRTYFWGRAG